MKERENFASRLGFILVSAGCAIGIGNVWRFPYITGKYGGAAFVLIYLFFLVIMGLPVMIMEFAVGRAAGLSVGRSFEKLEPEGSRWHLFSHFAFAGNYILMMYYTTVSGWMLAYVYKMAAGEFEGMKSGGAAEIFQNMLADPGYQIFWMLATIAIGFLVCGRGLQNGVEKISKPMMISLFVLMLILAVRSLLLPGGEKGLEFYLVPDFANVREQGLFTVVYAAMGQAFFTLSLGVGSMSIFGSYISKERTLKTESRTIIILDTFVALMAGLIIFPACFAYDVNPGSGPGLIFVTLPEIFLKMAGGRFWGTLFFIFMCFASLSTVIAVFENIIAICMDVKGWSRGKAVAVNAVLLPVLSIPCVLGFNVWSGFMPFGDGSNLMDLEDFIVSNNLLPLGSLIFILFCTSRFGWGFDRFFAEANEGRGSRLPRWTRAYLSYILPLIMIFIFLMGYKDKFFG